MYLKTLNDELGFRVLEKASPVRSISSNSNITGFLTAFPPWQAARVTNSIVISSEPQPSRFRIFISLWFIIIHLPDVKEPGTVIVYQEDNPALTVVAQQRNVADLAGKIQTGLAMAHRGEVSFAVIHQNIPVTPVQPPELGQETKFVAACQQVRISVTVNICYCRSVKGGELNGWGQLTNGKPAVAFIDRHDRGTI